MLSRTVMSVSSVAGAALLLALTGPVASSGAVAVTGSVEIIQAVPDTSVDVTIDGRQVKDAVRVGAVLGPFRLRPGKHTVRFEDPSGDVAMLTTSVSVGPGSNTDVVLHRPAAISGAPVVNVYATPRKAIGPGKARVLVAHTATVVPADVRVDGRTIFTNIANGEFAEADVPAGRHQVELFRTGQSTNPILGPVDVDLAERTVTMVYAVGTPMDGSMKVIAHSTRLARDGAIVPDKITTGSAGLAAHRRVTPFTTWDARTFGG